MLVTRERLPGVGAGVALDVDVDADGGVVRPGTDEVCVLPLFGMGAEEDVDGTLSDWLLRRLRMDAGTLALRCLNSLLESKDGARAESG